MGTPRVVYYRGKPLQDCTREELIKAVEGLMERLEIERRWQESCERTEQALWNAALEGKR